jgi:hypothetical protein
MQSLRKGRTAERSETGRGPNRDGPDLSLYPLGPSPRKAFASFNERLS